MKTILHFKPRWLYLIIIPFFLQSVYVKAQEASGGVSGLVKNEVGEILPSVTIVAENITTHVKTSTITDDNGVYKFSDLPVKGSYKFTFTSVGYEPETLAEYTLKTGQSITMLVRLSASNSVLNQVVVTGYTTQRKKDLTGAVSVVDVNDTKSTPTASFDAALQGRVAGVTVVSSNQPGGGVAVRIRGLGTINNSDPLYIIDGIPVTSGLGTLNTSDIESIQVLKDASSASIYGARAANGVIIVTTRKAKVGQSQVLYDGYTGIQQVYNLPQLLNPSQYGQLWFTALKNGGQTPPKGNPYGTGDTPVIPQFLDAAKTTPAGNTNWYKEIFQPAIVQSHTISFLNGTEKGSTVFNVGYYDQQGIMKYASDFKRYTARLNTDYNLFKQRLKVGEYLSIGNTQDNNVSDNAALGSAMTSALFADPLLPVYDINHNFAGPAANMTLGGRNPLAQLYNQQDNYEKQWRILGKAFADLTIVKGLTLSTNYAVDYTNYNSKGFSPTYAEGTLLNSLNSVSYSNSYTLNTTWTNTLNYKHNFGKSAFDIIGGTEYIYVSSQKLGASISALPSNDLNVQQINAGTASVTNSGSGVYSALFSVFSKINYAYNDKYLASFTLRNDASSKLAPGYNTQAFPAFSLGWRISDEPFFAPLKDKINEVKLRGGWGQTGNQSITDYSFYSTYAPNTDNNFYDINGSNTSSETGYAQNRIGNNTLRWETTTQTNLGLDVSALNDKITLTLDLFDKKTNDLLVNPQLPATFGSASAPFINGGSMDNKGIELEAGYNSRTGSAFNYSINGNISYIKNKLTSLTPDLAFIASPVSNDQTRNLELQRTVVGQPVASFYGYKVIGIFQNQQQVDSYIDQPGKAVGHFIYADENPDGKIDDNDRVFLGSPQPTINYGFNLKMSYKNFDFWTFFQGVAGNSIYNFTKEYTDFFSSPSSSNKSIRLLNAWSPTNMISNGPPILTTGNTADDTRPSSYFVESGSYMRLKTLQIGYTFSNGIFKNKSLNKMRIYLQAENLFTITKYSGIDPEGNTASNLNMNVDRGTYPASKIIMLGLNAKF